MARSLYSVNLLPLARLVTLFWKLECLMTKSWVSVCVNEDKRQVQSS